MICRRCVNEFIDRHLILFSWVVSVFVLVAFWNLLVHL